MKVEGEKKERREEEYAPLTLFWCKPYFISLPGTYMLVLPLLNFGVYIISAQCISREKQKTKILLNMQIDFFTKLKKEMGQIKVKIIQKWSMPKEKKILRLPKTLQKYPKKTSKCL